MDLFNNTAAARAARLFTLEPEANPDEPGMFTITVRVPARMAATLTTMANHAGVSRNELSNLVLEAGVRAVWNETPSAIQQEIAEAIVATTPDFL